LASASLAWAAPAKATEATATAAISIDFIDPPLLVFPASVIRRAGRKA
jgi:hypothetical protein